MLADEIKALTKDRPEVRSSLEDGKLKIIGKRGFQARSISDKEKKIYNIPSAERKSVFRNNVF